MASILDLKVTQQGDDLPSGNNVSFEKAYADAIENKILPQVNSGNANSP